PASPSAAPATQTKPTTPSAPATQARPDLPERATLAWAGTYRLELPSGHSAPQVVGRGRSGHLWFVDAANHLTTLDPVTGAAYTISELPKSARIRSIEVGTSYVFAIDIAASRVYVVSLANEKVT